MKYSIPGKIPRFRLNLDAIIPPLAETTADQIRLLLNSSIPTGRLYRRPGNRGAKLHRASRPGQPPAIESGALFESINSNRIDKDSAVAGVRGGPYYASLLETGGTDEIDGNNIAPRPYAEPSMRAALEKFQIKGMLIR